MVLLQQRSIVPRLLELSSGVFLSQTSKKLSLRLPSLLYLAASYFSEELASPAVLLYVRMYVCTCMCVLV